jgi:hypothetical protein
LIGRLRKQIARRSGDRGSRDARASELDDGTVRRRWRRVYHFYLALDRALVVLFGRRLVIIVSGIR